LALGLDGLKEYDQTMRAYTYEIPDPDNLFPPVEKPSRQPSGPLIPFEPPQLVTSSVLGREIEKWTPNAGTYGMGGPGFLGFRFDTEWLIVAIWGAGRWFRLEGRLLADFDAERSGRPAPWDPQYGPNDGTPFTGKKFVEFNLERNSIRAKLNDGRVLELSSNSSDRPPFAGNGKPRLIEKDDDLRRVAFLCPTNELWIPG
jgi:hypothetical protein